MELNIYIYIFFSFQTNPLRRSVSCYIRVKIGRKKVKVKIGNILKILSRMVTLLCNNEKTEDITTFAYYRNTRNKQTIKRRLGKK